jgi:NADH-quinone oxidoreductase subunit L
VSDYAQSETIRWIPLVPLIVALGQALMLFVFRRSLSYPLAVVTSCGAALMSFVLTCVAFWELVGASSDASVIVDRAYTWVGLGVGDLSFTADLAFALDPLSAVVALVVTGVMLCGSLYAGGYMRSDPHDDGGHQRFFCYLNLFLSSMLVLVLADNLLLFFVGWEGAALCSYLLIGFWYADPSHAAKAQRAFVIDRIGDFGFLVGLMTLFFSLASVGEASVAFRDIEAHVARLADSVVVAPSWLGGESWSVAAVIGLCFFLAACARSAQGPMLVWLPESMVAPTPASALVHAALGVTGGVYLLCRLSFLYSVTPEVAAVIAWTGAVTAGVAALAATVQTDIKKLLAYATASQLGMMFVAVGCGAYTAAIFHLTTHAFFAALLFLAAGSVVLAMNHERDIRKMGGLRSKLIRVHLVMAVGVAAAAGFPFLSGFFSRNEILLAARYAEALPGYELLYASLLLAAALLAFALSRMLFMIFYGQGRLPARIRSDMEDPGNWIIVPLYVLGALAIFGGLLGLPQFWGDALGVDDSNSLGNFVAGAVASGAPRIFDDGEQGWVFVGVLASSLAGFAIALQLYVRRPELSTRLPQSLAGFRELLRLNFHLDQIAAALPRPLLFVSDRLLSRFVERDVVDGWILSAPARAVRGFVAGRLRYTQSGMAQAYLFSMLAGSFALLVFLLY